ncbi:SusC/RagA family TonB-linked outer membrane protein [Hymenobacter jeollabukensis]|uniref:TonB-dependent receptor n=1 Tax=Hymenobacter jeollabukensis TaxID=2025313 RepID=A0A5R8WXE9_9BACT|nr:TonB-dependent receptor [Hymenobacter jeollabukensis]TLM97136.1 TonB-dependent receptor [Hymenobacter jeollabukensis]
MSYHFYPHSILRRAVPLAACGLLTLAAPALAAASPGDARSHRPAVADVPVSGRVTQTDGAPMPGVTVIVKGTTLGTSTNAEGQFSLNVPEGSTLVISAVGFMKQEIPVSGATTGLDVKLQEDLQALGEVVVVGYGTQQRSSVTGAVASVSGQEIRQQPISDPTQALQGRAAGVTVTQNSGAPGGAGGTSVRVRGVTSAGYNAPLYVVDGFPLPPGDENQLNAISPNDIESIDVLKDAAQASIYGVRAANGVVIITTKRGKAGKASINLDAYRGVQQVWRKLDMLNAREYAVINNEGRIAGNTALLPKLQNPQSLGEGTDWQDQIFRRAAIQNYSLTATGGSDKARYAVAGSYYKQDGTIVGSNFERFTLRANGDLDVNKWFRMGNSLSLTHLSDRQVNTTDEFNGIVTLALQMPPTVEPYKPDGTWNMPDPVADAFTEPNPLIEALLDKKKFTRNRVLSTLYAELEPVKGLRFRTNVGVDMIFDYSRYFRPGIPSIPKYATITANANSAYSPSYLIENTLTYDHLFAGKHQVTALLGQSGQQFNFYNLGGGRSDYVRPDLQELDAGPRNDKRYNNGTSSETSLASYFGRFNYEYAGKYMLAAIVRYDGSSAFKSGERFGFFPGVSAGWRLSEEGFLQDNRLISNLKLRAGYGVVGNPANAGAFASLPTINTDIIYPFGEQGQTVNQGAAPTRLPNDLLKWEKNQQLNVGLDLGFWDNRVEAIIDVYNRKSPNLIAGVPPSRVSGTYEAPPTNAASAYNRGIDLALTTRNIAKGELTWTTTLNFSTYKNELTSLGSGLPYDGQVYRSGAVVRYDKGHPFGFFRGFVADGLFQTEEDVQAHATQAGAAPGDIRFKDVNGDGTINDLDRTQIGNPNPDFTYGLINNVAWKGFDLYVFLQGSQGNDVYNLNRFYTEGGLNGNGNSTTRVLGRWTGPGTSNSVPRATTSNPNQNQRVSSYYVEDGSYMRIKALTLGYSLPKKWVGAIGGQQVRVYVSSQNLLTLTKYSGFDPEVGGNAVDRGTYPQARTFLGGVNIGF